MTNAPQRGGFVEVGVGQTQNRPTQLVFTPGPKTAITSQD
jgi:hypothetical protein